MMAVCRATRTPPGKPLGLDPFHNIPNAIHQPVGKAIANRFGIRKFILRENIGILLHFALSKGPKRASLVPQTFYRCDEAGRCFQLFSESFTAYAEMFTDKIVAYFKDSGAHSIWVRTVTRIDSQITFGIKPHGTIVQV